MSSPLADRLRPEKIEDMVGQKHLLAEGMPLRNILDSGTLPNLIFYGPSGTGKTTLAKIIAKTTNRKLHKLNGTNASTADIKEIVSELDTSRHLTGYCFTLTRYSISIKNSSNRFCST